MSGVGSSMLLSASILIAAVSCILQCHEKIAGTYKREEYLSVERTSSSLSVTSPSRQYERQMEHALNNYFAAMKEAKVIEEDGGFADIPAGGSEHGAVEVFYRLHASRLKCLLFAVRQRGEVRDLAESEALRLAAKHWYVAPPGKEPSFIDQVGIRERVWDTLADVVAALAQCRLDQPFFHRSVYRHAQALMVRTSYGSCNYDVRDAWNLLGYVCY